MTLCFLAIYELPFRGHSEGEDSINRGVYRGLLNLLASYDAILNIHLETATTFRGTSNRIQNDLIQALSDVVLDKIKSGVKDSRYVALLLDETSDITNGSQLSTTLGYVESKSAEVHERLISFNDVSADKTASGLLEHVVKIVDEFDLNKKKEVLNHKKSSATFYDDVITKFTSQERRMDFTFK